MIYQKDVLRDVFNGIRYTIGVLNISLLFTIDYV